MKIIDLTGKVFGRLTAVRMVDEVRHHQRMWLCVCECGVSKNIQGNSLRSGATRSCGCLHSERIGKASTKHGHSRRGAVTKAYIAWGNMWARVTDTKGRGYAHYGAKGVQISPRWETFEGFLADMGEPPEGLTLERKEVTGNYEPGNCIWATQTAQANNKRATKRYQIDGVDYTQAQLARLWGIGRRPVVKRLKELGLWTGPHKRKEIL